MRSRIIGGQWRGRKLIAPKGLKTRPTSSRVREALFNVLGADVRDVLFCDFFAGSGAVGLEALSRGAAKAIFIESARPAIISLRRNIEILQCENQIEVISKELPNALSLVAYQLADQPTIIFFDPPYHKELYKEIFAELESEAEQWTQAIMLIMQCESGVELQEQYGPWILRKRYPHGDSALWFYHQQPSSA